MIDGRVRLLLAERQIIVETGEAAGFASMTPHAMEATDGPAEVTMVFDRDGQRAHVHRDIDDRPVGTDGRPSSPPSSRL